MKDRLGLDYQTLLAQQQADLQLWGSKCREEVIDAVADYVRKHNVRATDQGLHQVFRGQDLIELIRQWPDVKPPYPSNASTEDVL